MGPLVYFATTGPQTIRVQTREDGFAIDQIVLSRSTYLSTAPGRQKDDTTILPEQTGGSTPPPADTTVPTAQITAPSNGATVSGTVNVAATAADNVAVSRVDFLVYGAQAGSDSAAPYQFAWNTSGLANGTHTLQARAVDSSNNVGSSAVVSVTVNNVVSAPPSDTTAPTAQITSPSNGATVSGTANVAVTASDNVGVSRVELLLDGAQVATDSAAPYQFAWDTSGVANGTHTLRARAVDSSNNTGLSAIITVTVNNTVAQNEEIVLWHRQRRCAGRKLATGVRRHSGRWAAHAHPDGGGAKITTAAAAPANYFEVTFNAVAGRPYRIWMRGKAEANYWANDSVFLQFNGSVDSGGANIWRIGTTSAAEYNLEEASGFGVSEWGWQDNGWGAGVLGPLVYFKTTGPQTLRIQTREDGLSIDQIVLSPAKYLSSAPGPNKNDTTLLGKTQ